MRTSLLTVACAAALTLFAQGCVSQGKYDAAVRDANDARAEVERASRACAQQRGDLQRKLDDQTAINAQLGDELTRLGQSADDLLAERGSLSTALEQSRARLDELRRAQASAEMRARFYRELALRLKSMVDAGELTIGLRDGRMVLQLPNDVLFASGQTDIRPQGQAALKQIGAVLKTVQGRHFQVAGHTDNVPIETDRFPSNWELSTARALQVTRFLVAQGVKAPELSAAGYGEHDPVASNDDPRGRAKNRRIEITVVPNIDELVSVPNLR